ncbi:MAG TPA: class II glutamine amidotransferase [Chryseolinea sp.]
MCRLMAYMGSPIIIDKLLYQPKNSLINQSINARELEEPLNGDGFGIGWYVSDVNYEPVTFVSINPAWSNRNLRNLAPKIRTECFIAHVRAASVGEVSESNCHPFQYQNLLMMHNGGVENFSLIKRQIREPLSDEFYNWIKGQTDSEHIFALLLHYLYQEDATLTPETVILAFERTFEHLNRLMKQCGINDPAYLNMVVTNGLFVVGTRYVSDPKETALTLYHSEAAHYAVENGVGQLRESDEGGKAILVVSEKLSDEKHWTLVPSNHFVIVDHALNVETRPIN